MSTAIEDTTAITTNPIIAQAIEFTEAFKRHFNDHPAIREARCLQTQYPALVGDIRAGDVLAGRNPAGRLAYVGTMWWAAPPRKPFSPTKQGGFCFDFELADRIGKTDEEKRVLAELSEFWKDHCTWTKANALYDETANRFARGNGQIMCGANGFCVAVNIDRLLQRGLPGLMLDVQKKQKAAQAAGQEMAFYDGLAIAIDVVIDVARHYRKQATQLAEKATSPDERARMMSLAENLGAIMTRAPQTFREAVQLFWLYTNLVSGHHPESHRLDQALGDFFARDIDAGRISEEEAIELVVALWRIIGQNGADALCRIVIGGLGRRNVANADRFCLAAMEATRRHRRVTPQLTLRFHRGQDPKLLRKAYDCLGEGCCFPMLYNDDVCVPGVAKSMHLSEEAAQDYYPLGCGEYMIGWRSPSVLCVGWSIGKSLDAALHNGKSNGQVVGPESGDPAGFDTYEKLYEAYMQQIRFSAGISAQAYHNVLAAVPKELPFLLASLVTDNCLENGKGILEGSRHIGGCVMGHGFTNAADSLVAICKLVYEQKKLTLTQLIAALDANFDGQEDLRKVLAAIPKFGNDDEQADQTLVKMYQDISAAADDAGKRYGLSFHTVSSVNPGGYGLGADCPASADGRRKGDSFAIGHAPTAGKDTSGLTALMNSVAKADPANGGAVTNFKISRELFTRSRPKLEAMFSSYFASGGQEATVTVVNRDDLEAAMKEPSKYTHVLVRLGGWCARFIDLEKNIQEEIIRRTLY